MKEILNTIRNTVRKTNPDYDLVIKRLNLHYDMKLVTLGMYRDKNLITQFPVFIQPYTQQLLIKYQIETVPVQIRPKHTSTFLYTSTGRKAVHCTKLRDLHYHMAARIRTCKTIGHEFYCKELLVVKHKSKYSCESAIHFDLDVMKENCKFNFYYNKTYITLTVLDGRNKIILVKWPNNKHIICSINNDIPIYISENPVICIYL